jgi:hypothetical protein
VIGTGLKANGNISYKLGCRMAAVKPSTFHAQRPLINRSKKALLLLKQEKPPAENGKGR